MSASIIPTLRYEDAQKAIDWLCNAFGFKLHEKFQDENGIIIHAQLIFGSGMIMLSEYRESKFDTLVKNPHEVGAVTQSAYIIVKEIKAHYEKAKQADAQIKIELKTEPHGTGYSCTDLEGHLWNFGNYNPWTKQES